MNRDEAEGQVRPYVKRTASGMSYVTSDDACLVLGAGAFQAMLADPIRNPGPERDTFYPWNVIDHLQLRSHMSETKQVRVFTAAYRPFLMGGDVAGPVGTDVVPEATHDIGQGLSVYEITAPTGHKHFAETTTGAFVGTDLEVIRSDLAQASPEVVQLQLEHAQQQADKIDVLPAEEFWSLFQRESEE